MYMYNQMISNQYIVVRNILNMCMLLFHVDVWV